MYLYSKLDKLFCDEVGGSILCKAKFWMRVYVSSPHASSTERRLAASATEWGFPRKSAVEEAFLRHRAKLHVEAKRRERREAMKDPTRRLQRLKASEAKNETSRRNI